MEHVASYRGLPGCTRYLPRRLPTLAWHSHHPAAGRASNRGQQASARGVESIKSTTFLDGQTFDPEIVRLIAFEAARAAVNRPADLTDEMIANKIIELANAGERNVEVLCEAALNVPTGAVSAPNLPSSLASPPDTVGS